MKGLGDAETLGERVDRRKGVGKKEKTYRMSQHSRIHEQHVTAFPAITTTSAHIATTSGHKQSIKTLPKLRTPLFPFRHEHPYYQHLPSHTHERERARTRL